MIPRHLETIFCDDVRTEASGKRIYIGVYGSHLLVDEFPARLQQLCIVVTAVTPVDEPFEKLIFRVTERDDSPVLYEVEVPVNALISNENKILSTTRVAHFIQSTISVPNIEIKNEGPLCTHMETEAGIIHGGVLHMMLQSDFDQHNRRH